MRRLLRRFWGMYPCPTCGYRPQTHKESVALASSACTACGSTERAETSTMLKLSERYEERLDRAETRANKELKMILFIGLPLLGVVALLNWLGWF